MNNLEKLMNEDSDKIKLELGVSEELLVINSQDKLTATLVDMFQQCRSTIQLFSHDLETTIYNYLPIYQSLANMINKNQRARVEILVQNVDSVVKADHCLVELMRNMSGFVEIRTTAIEYRHYDHAFVLIDNCGYYHRHPQDSRKFEICYNNKAFVREMSGQFKSIWDQSARSSELLQLFI